MKILLLAALLLAGPAVASHPAVTSQPAVTSHPAGGFPLARPASDPVWRWPLAGPGGAPPRVVRPFAPPALRWQRGHRGADLSAPGTATVLAAGAGTVAFAGTLFGRGVVVVSHGVLRTSYQPVTPSVQVGATVEAGTPLGTLAAGHCPQAACLHWGLLTGYGHAVRYYDPLLLLGRVRLRLEPVPAPP